MSVDAMLDEAVDAIADGKPVDWDLLDSHAEDDDERARVKWLRVVGAIADLHRSFDEEDESAAAQSRSPGSGESHGDDDTGGPGGARGDAADAAGERAKKKRTWGRYELHDKVGEGSFGSVFRAWDPQLERTLALKILHRRVTDDRLRERLLREGRALAKVRQANVVSVYAVESHADRVGLCMEFISGETLEDELRHRGRLNARDAAIVGEDVCKALAAVHDAGLVHRDVKARNVMREDGGRIVLMDFGTGREARLLDAGQRADVVGTPMYMAPEVLAGAPASTRSDVYAVGVLLYHLVTGSYPIDAPSLDDLRAAHKAGRRKFLREHRLDLPVLFVRVVERALAADAQDRYADAGALLDALSPLAGERGKKTRVIPQPVAYGLAGATFALCAPLALGFLNSDAFNIILGRWEFASDGLWDWWVWGLRASVGPLFILLSAWLVSGLLSVIRRLMLGLSPIVRRLDARVSHTVAMRAYRLGLDDASVLSSWVLVLSTSALLTAWWYYFPLITALGTRLSTGPADQLAWLSPPYESLHDEYRKVFSSMTLLMIAAWYLVLKLAKRREVTVSRRLLAGGVAIVGLSLVSLDFPYRLLLHNQFEAVRWQARDCYVIGDRGEELLLSCPALDPPRNRVVSRSDPSLERLGRRESLFTRFSSIAARSGTGTANSP